MQKLANLAKINIVTGEGRLIGFHGKTRLAHLCFDERNDGSILLGDIQVFEQVFTGNRLSDRLIRRIFPKWKVACPRRLGVGTILLQRFLEDCDGREIPLIFGNICKKDDAQPFLRDWYCRHDFEIVPPKTFGCRAINNLGAVCQIVHHLRSK